VLLDNCRCAHGKEIYKVQAVEYTYSTPAQAVHASLGNAAGPVPEGAHHLQNLKVHAEQCSQQHAQHDLARCPQGSHNSPHQPWVLVNTERSIRKGNAAICASAPFPKLAHMSLSQILHGINFCDMSNRVQQTSECAAGTRSWKGQLPRNI